MRVQTMEVTLDEYIFFHEFPIQRDLPNRHLNQIISMHGFKKIHRRPKKDILDALSSIDLLLPFRSTLLMQNISSSASLTKEEVSSDLASLSWQECALQSIETLSSIKRNGQIQGDCHHLQDQASGFKLVTPKSENGLFAGEETGRWVTKRKREIVGAVEGSGPVSGSAAQLLPFWLSF